MTTTRQNSNWSASDLRLCAVFVACFLLRQPALGAVLEVPPVAYPILVRHAQSLRDFVPEGWRLECEVQGDLNGDNLPDDVLVLRAASRNNVLDVGARHFDTNPRILAIALADPGGGYRLAAENHTLIPRATQPNADDYLEPESSAIEIRRGVLRVRLRLFMSSGGWDTRESFYSFQYRSERFELIGYDRSDVSRNSATSTDISVNYLTGREKVGTGSVSSDRPDKVIWKSIPRRPLLTIDQVGDGLAFNPAA